MLTFAMLLRTYSVFSAGVKILPWLLFFFLSFPSCTWFGCIFPCIKCMFGSEATKIDVEWKDFVKLALVKDEVNPKRFMFGYISVNMSWTINSNIKNMFGLWIKIYQSWFQVRINIILLEKRPNMSKFTSEASHFLRGGQI